MEDTCGRVVIHHALVGEKEMRMLISDGIVRSKEGRVGLEIPQGAECQEIREKSGPVEEVGDSLVTDDSLECFDAIAFRSTTSSPSPADYQATPPSLPRSDDSHEDDQTVGTSPLKVLLIQSLLLITAPAKNKHDEDYEDGDDACARNKQDYVTDVVARNKQYENFCQLYPALQNSLASKAEVVVNTFHDIEHKITDFFQTLAAQAVWAVIIFNGHGSEAGLQLCKENLDIPLDTFIKAIATLLDQHRKDDKDRLPHFVRIVFAQCHAHFYKEVDRHDIHVTCFTTDNCPKTECRHECDPLSRELVDSEHKGLQDFASQQRVADETCLGIRRSSSQSALRKRYTSEVSTSLEETVTEAD